MKKLSIKSKINLWYILFIVSLGIAVVLTVSISTNLSEKSEIQQEIIRNVERNVDEIEISNGILDIEADFSLKYSDTYFLVYSEKGDILKGKAPDDMDLEFRNKTIQTAKINGNKYYIYDTLLCFNNFEYIINSNTGEIVSTECESENESSTPPSNANMDFKSKGCKLSYQDAYDIALKSLGLDESQVTLMFAKSSEHNGEPVYDIEFTSKGQVYENVWVRGIMPADYAFFNLPTLAAIIILIIIVAFAGIVGYVILKKSLAPLDELVEDVSDIESYNDLSKRVNEDNHDEQLNRLSAGINRMIARLERSFKAERQFASDASHELRTPLSVILAECEYQLDRKEIKEEERNGFDSIKTQSLSMKELVQQLLQLSRLDQSNPRLDFSYDDLSELVGSVCANMHTVANEKNIIISENIEPSVMMNMDMILMCRLCENLISNAIKYGRENGRVDVTLEKREEKIVLTVADDGIGIPEDEIDFIWQRFYCVNKARTKTQESFGLGLSMVKEIATIHHAQIYVKSKLGEGTSFSVEFPNKN